jgi:fermentation-respiration switch protein FrsA (DUF1100 family)
MQSLFRRWVIVAAGATLALGGALWFIGGELSAAVPRSIGAAPVWLAADSVRFSSDSGSLIHGWFSPGVPGRGAILLLHGVRGDRRDMLSRADFLHRLGYATLLIDFQAHGESPGERITFGYLESHDVAAALADLKARAPGERLAVIGVSLGAAAFVLSENRPAVHAVVLESMYPTIEQAVADRMRLYLGVPGALLTPLLTVQFGPRLGFDAGQLRPIDRIALIGAPVLILHGTQDRHTSIDEARVLFAAANPPKEFWAVDAAAHVNLHTYAKAEYERRVGAFLAAYLQRGN